MIVEEIARAVALVMFALFVATYAVLARWWRDPVGRNLMAMMLVIAGLLATGSGVARALHPVAACWARTGLFVAAALVAGHRLVLLLAARRQARRKRGRE